MRPKLVVNEPTLESPTAKQMSATDQSVVRSSAAARSRRRVRRYWWGDSPKARRNSRLKCAGDSRASRAMSGTSRGSPYRASARSLARSRWRAGGTGAMTVSGSEVGHVRAHRVAAALRLLPVLLAAESGQVEEVVRTTGRLEAAGVLRVG